MTIARLVADLDGYEREIYDKQREALFPKVKQRLGRYWLGEETKNEKGEKLCVNCGKVIIGNRKHKYCSSECSEEWWKTHDWGYLKSVVFYKRGYVCQKCGYTPPKEPEWSDFESSEKYWESHEEWNKTKKTMIVDHIKPIALGGEELDENNLQILCEDCNREKTKKDQARIVKKRHEIALPINPFEVSLKNFDGDLKQQMTLFDFVKLRTFDDNEM